jgi:cytoskeletal protein CcmA (bactofilin family)
MFNREKASGHARVAHAPTATLLGEGTHWEGEIHTGPTGIRIEGTVDGTVLSEGLVVVAPSGLVRGTIYAKQLAVLGRIEGVFKIEGCLEIHGTGWVEGEVELDTLVVDEGGTLQGTCHRRTATKGNEALPLVPRKEAPAVDRALPSASGTLGSAHEVPVGRSLGRSRF